MAGDTQRRVFTRVRRVCLAFPETSETPSWGHPNFRAGTKTFCTLEIVDGRPSIALRLSPTDVELVLRRRHFFDTPYGRGRWASVWADVALDWTLVERLLERSYRLVANKRMLGTLEARALKSGPARPPRRPRRTGRRAPP